MQSQNRQHQRLSEYAAEKSSEIRREIAQLRRKNTDFLYLCQIHLTHSCNILPIARCKDYCYNWQQWSGNMPMEVLHEIIDTYTPRQIALGGGEPTLHPQFAECISYAKGAGVKHVNYTTNGVTIPTEFERVTSLVSGVSISLDTYRYPTLFTEGIPEPIGHNLRAYLKSTVQVVLNYVVGEANLSTLESVIPFMSKHGIDQVYFLGYKEPGDRWVHHPELKTTLKEKLLQVYRLALEQNILMGYDCCLESALTNRPCPAGSRFKAFNPDGSIYPCSFTRMYPGMPCPFSGFRVDPEEEP